MDHVVLRDEDDRLLRKVTQSLPILSDVCRSDLLLFATATDGTAVVIAEGKPHSVNPLYADRRTGTVVSGDGSREVWRALHGRGRFGRLQTIEVRGATIARLLYPVFARRRVIAVLAVDSYWLAWERHRRRASAFQAGLVELIRMALRGELEGAETLTPFGEHDGLIYVGADERVQYMSGIALSMYRRLGFRDSLVGVPVDHLDPVDHALFQQTRGQRACRERQDTELGLTWVRKALPVNTMTPPGPLALRLSPWRRHLAGPWPFGVMILLHDATEALEAQRELESKTAMLREVHHRVKNNLQVIASLMRMQARRTESEDVREALEENINRIMSVAVVHEYLSQNAQGTINLQEVANRIVSQVQRDLVDPGRPVKFEVKGPVIWLPAERATQCALVINELVQNAIGHGIGVEGAGGGIVVELGDDGERVSIRVTDDGTGLPEGFSLETDAHLGLRIVQSMVERDLRGRFELTSGSHGTRAVVQFDKSQVGGN